MSVTYHGPVPVSKPDIIMAKKHLKSTLALKKTELNMNLQKIADHQQAASNTNNPKSVAYNKGHILGHVKDNKSIKKVIAERQASVKTVNNLKPQGDNMAFNTKKTGTYKGKSNVAGGGGRFKQMTDNGVSPGLAAYIGKKKFGAAQMAKMAAPGKK